MTEAKFQSGQAIQLDLSAWDNVTRYGGLDA